MMSSDRASRTATGTTTAAGSLILVAPGTYRENVIMFKPVRLQGAGAGGTFIDGNPTPQARLQTWHDRLNSFGALGGFIAPVLKNWAEGAFHSPAAGLYVLAGTTVIAALLVLGIRSPVHKPSNTPATV